MQCAFCKEIIDDDSFHCDLCGEEIKICPGCKKLGKVKVCTSCGTFLISLKSQAEPLVASGTSAQLTDPLAGSKAPDLAASVSGTRRLLDSEQVKSVVPQLRLLNKNINVDLKIDDNSIVGRADGQYVAIFSCLDQVSSKHCCFNYDPGKGWCVTDLGSTNKTTYNNQELVPNRPQIISDQAYLKIANIEFFIRIIPG